MTKDRLRVAIATGNAGKFGEFTDLLGTLGAELVGVDPAIDEVGLTYLENARLKAITVMQSTGLPSLGDDSGIEVEALGGYPGLFSARIAATQWGRNQLLLDRLAGRPKPWRAAFVCALAVAVPGLPVVEVMARVEGEIVSQPIGSEGFGYDPIFLLPDLNRTVAQLTPEEKHSRSHRGAAVRRLLELQPPGSEFWKPVGRAGQQLPPA